MGIGAVVGALLGLGASGVLGTMMGMATIFGLSVGSLWLIGMSLGAMFDAMNINIGSPNYTLDPIRNSMSQLIPVPVAYGRVRVAGNIVMQRFQNTDRKTVYQHIVLSEGPIKSVGYSDVYVNDSPTSTLSEVTKYLYTGGSDQDSSPYDPDGVGYPNTAYLSMKITASEKIKGNPTVTTILTGRDFDYPGKGSPGTLLGCDTTGTGGFSHSDKYGYKNTTVTSHCIGLKKYRLQTGHTGGENPKPIYSYSYDDFYSFSFYSNTYTNPAVPVILTFPMYFRWGEKNSNFSTEWSAKFRIRVYPDSNNSNTYFDFNDLSVGGEHLLGKSFVRTLPNGVALLWELRRTLISDYGDDAVSGIMQIKLPETLLPSSGKAKVVVTATWVSNRELIDYTPEPGSHVYDYDIWAALLPYTDCLTDNPPAGFQIQNGIFSPAWVIYDLLTDKVYGGGIPADLIDIDSFSTVANQCQEEGIEVNIVFDQQRSLLDSIKDVLTVCRGFLVFRDKIKLLMDAPVMSYTREVTESDIIDGSFEYWVSPKDKIPNKVTVEYIDGDIDGGGTWERVVYSVEDWDDIDARGIFEQRYSMLGITRKSQAKAMANYLFESFHRNRFCCAFAGNLSISDIEVGDVIAVTHSLPGWDKKLIRVVGVYDEPDCIVRISGIEYSEEVYNTSDDV